MVKMKLIIFFILFMSSLYSSSNNEILLLHSYNNGLKWSDNITKGIQDILDKYPEYELTIESMDSKKIDTNDYFDNLLSLYKKKFSNRKYAVVITADNYAFEFALSHHEDIFNNSPIVFCGVENFNEKIIPTNQKKYVTGVVEYKEIEKNINLISKTIKDLNTLYIISDESFSSEAIKNQILEEIHKFKNKFKIIFDNQIDIDTISEKINSLPPNSAVLFTSLYRDKNNKYIPYSQLRTLFKSSKYPVFATNKIHLNEGVIGGIVVDPFEQGFLAAQKTIEILDGKEPYLIPISKPVSKYYFDYNVLEKFNLNSSSIPLLATVLNKPKNFFEENREFIDSTFILIPLFILLIIGLIVNITKRIGLEIKLIEQNKLDSVLLNNIKGAVYWKSNDNKILGCNDSLCRLLDLSKENIIGYDIKKVIPELFEKVNDENEFVEEMETILNFKHRKVDALIRRRKYFNKNNEEAGVVTIVSDLTQLKKLENQRKKNEQFIIQRSKLSEIGEMMTSIAHQWKAPLIEISTIAQELLYKKNKKEFTKEDNQEFVNEIMTQVQYMTKTIDDFRSFIKPSLIKSEFDVNSAMDELLRVVEHNIKYNYIKIEVSYEDNKRFNIYGYPNEFKQTILSIINNSRDSILKRRQTEEFEGLITIEIKSQDNKTILSIKDNGIGIKEENLERIFEPFFTSKKNGDGFGLYMVKLIIEDKMNGKIEAIKCHTGANILISLINKVES
ncbi:histidine kinase [Arcobacter venerupis]|nr:histidine kinase [Arcobacter venerupis]